MESKKINKKKKKQVHRESRLVVARDGGWGLEEMGELKLKE